MASADLEPFTVDVTAEQIADLRARLALTRWPDQLPGTTWELGTDVAYLRRLVAHWGSGFDFDGYVARCNRWPQVRTTIDDTQLHAIVAESPRPEATPLVLLHGWPGSVVEFFDVVEPLRQHHHVIVPSLPGYGFSGPTTRAGIDPAEIARLLLALLGQLGHERFLVAGGDWGAMIGATMATRHPEHVLGLHLTILPVAPPESDRMAGVTDAEAERLGAARAVMRTGVGYQRIQSTKPQSLAYGLTDSPAGLAGWITEKFEVWTDLDIEEAFTMDRLLENISTYWFTGTINSSIRLYHEAWGPGGRTSNADIHVGVPTGHAIYPGEIYPVPRAWADRQYEIVRWTTMDAGGHFAAMQVPEAYTADLLAFTSDVIESYRAPS